jgi:hypothetical protein
VNPVSQSLIVTRRTENKTQKIQMSSSYSWRPGMETSGVVGNRELLRVRKATAMR